MKGLFAGAWRYRYFIISSIQSEFRLRVARSRLGILWIVISPLMQVAIYAFVLSSVMSQRQPGIDSRYAYSIYLMSGFLAWFPFVEIVTRCMTVFIDNANVMKKIAFPRIVLPLICFGSAAINNLIFFLLIMVVYILIGYNPGMTLLWFLPLFLLTSALALGIGLILGVLNVFIRDVQQMVAILLQLGFWMTPIVYRLDIIPQPFRQWLPVNPLYWLVENHHRALAYGMPPDFTSLIWLSLLAIVTIALALFLFRRASPEIVDAL